MDTAPDSTSKYLTSCYQRTYIRLFSPPDTTGVTQLLDQLNKNIHHEYRKTRDDMYTSVQTINREPS